jgi:elongation factor Ts
MDCKRALTESDGDYEKAVLALREKGLSTAAKMAGRDAREGIVTSYIHHGSRLGVLLELNCETDFVARTDDFQALARDLALHVASADPLAVAPEDVPEELVARERRIAEEQVVAEGKPEAVRGKIVEGKIRKSVAERALTEQPYVKDDAKTVGQLIKEISGKLGEAVSVRRFARFRIGED